MCNKVWCIKAADVESRQLCLIHLAHDPRGVTCGRAFQAVFGSLLFRAKSLRQNLCNALSSLPVDPRHDRCTFPNFAMPFSLSCGAATFASLWHDNPPCRARARASNDLAQLWVYFKIIYPYCAGRKVARSVMFSPVFFRNPSSFSRW